MANQLFIICPFSGMESYLQNKYGKNIFFITYSGAIVQQQDFDYMLEVKYLIYREKIKRIYIVNDTSCRFINGIIKRNKTIGFPSQKVIEELYVEYYFSDFKDQSLFNQQQKLAEFNIKNQVDEIMNSTLFKDYIQEFSIEIKGLITSKEKRLFKEI
ncbi:MULTISPECIES: carbonic anhydrase [Rhodonellum]|nr:MULTISPECIES: carbonic anhydrase [Rhodonellum]SDZ32503.1 Carbonic anhydrase [Rhodonellum ikkaensis]